MCFGGGGDNGAAEARAAEEKRQADIRSGANQINQIYDDQFNDAFYQGISDDYIQFAQPDLERQMADAKRDLTLALSATGNLQSSEAARRQADLSRQIQDAELMLADTARKYADDQRNQIEASRSSLLSQNTAVADPAAMAINAQNQATAYAQMPTFEPLGALFDTVTQGLATQRDLEDRNKNRYTLFGSSGSGSSGSGKLYS